MKSFIIILSLITINITSAQDLEQISNWQSYPVPKDIDSLKEMFKIGFEVKSFNKNDKPVNVLQKAEEEIYYYLYLQDNNVFASSKKPQFSYELILPFKINDNFYNEMCIYRNFKFVKVEDGYLCGTDAGEFGGCLSWLSLNGDTCYRISRQNIKQFVTYNNRYFASQGLSHRGLDYGSIIEVYNVNNNWYEKEYFNTQSEPEFISLDFQNNLIIINSYSFFRLKEDLSIDSLGSQKFWKEHNHATSMVLKNNIVYVGFKNFVYQYDLISKSECILRKN